MTLVVARIHKGRISVVGDTLVTAAGDKALPPQEGTIKTWISPGNVSVSFANSPESAPAEFKRFLREFARGDFSNTVGFRFGFEETISYFEESSNRTGNDYIVAFDAPAHLVKITNGRRRSSAAKTVWIGDQAAYEAFREYEANSRHKPERGRALSAAVFADEQDESPASDIYSAFRNVIGDQVVSSVGGFAWVISNRGNGFRFSVYSDMLYDWPQGRSNDYQLSYSDNIDLIASHENDRYSVAQLAPNYIGLNAVAFYFPKSKTLFVYYGEPNGLACSCRVIHSVDAGCIKSELDHLFGADFGWLALVTSVPGVDLIAPSSLGLGNQRDGVRASLFVEANTFPKSDPSKKVR